MNCQNFTDKFAAFVAANLTAQQMHECELHMTSCEHCLELWAVHCGALDESGTVTGQQNLGEIMLAANLDPCSECEALLCDFVDQQLDDTNNALLTMHLETCETCLDTANALIGLNRDLPSLAYIRPPADLLDKILTRTMPWPQRWRNTFSAFSAGLKHMTLRPRFSLEASFMGTILWVIVFGIPVGYIDSAQAAAPIIDAVRTEADQVQGNIGSIGKKVSNTVSLFPPMMLRSGNSIKNYGNSLLKSGSERARDFSEKIIQTLNKQMDQIIFELPNRESES